MIKFLILIILSYPLYHMLRIWYLINRWVIPVVVALFSALMFAVIWRLSC